MRCALATAALSMALSLSSGCGFHSETNGGGDGGMETDLAGGGSDGSGAAGDLAATTPCARPYLLMNVDASQAPQVMRFSLAAGFDLCAPLFANHTLQPGTVATAFIPPAAVAVTGVAGTVLIDADRDQPLWSNTVDGIGILPFTLAGETLVGIARGIPGGAKQVDFLDAYRDASTRVRHYAFDGSGEPIGNVFGLAAHPLVPGHLLAMQIGNTPMAATEIDPELMTTSALAQYPAGAQLSKIGAAAFGATLRVAWIDDQANAIDSASNPMLATPLDAPLTCASQACTLVDVVPDPRDGTTFFGLCDYPAPGAHRSIVRLAQGQACTVVYDGISLPADLLATDLAVAP